MKECRKAVVWVKARFLRAGDKLVKPALLLFCIGLIALALAGCSSSSAGNGSPEQSIRDYYNAMMKEDYSKACELLADNYFKVANISREKWISDTKEFGFKNSAKITDFQISEIKDIDQTHKQAKILYKQSINGKEVGDSQDVLVAQENGKWLLDFSLVLASTPLPGTKVANQSNGKIELSNVVLHKTVNGLMLSFSIKNNTGRNLQFGWVEDAMLELTTDKGSWSVRVPSRTKLYSGKEEPVSFVFANADGNLKSLTMKGVYFLDNSGLPANNGPGMSNEGSTLQFQF